MHRLNADSHPDEIDPRCPRHPFEAAEDICGECGIGFCAACLVYPFGPSRPALCVSCALALAGVRAAGHHKGRLRPRELTRRRQLLADARAATVVDPLRLELDAHPDFDAAEAAAQQLQAGGRPSSTIDWAV